MSFLVAFAFGLVTVMMTDVKSLITPSRFENIESISDVDPPEIVIECDSNPYGLGRCWSARYDDNNVFLCCEFSCRSDSKCFGEIYRS